jgi:hypothetical protein
MCMATSTRSSVVDIFDLGTLVWSKMVTDTLSGTKYVEGKEVKGVVHVSSEDPKVKPTMWLVGL